MRGRKERYSHSAGTDDAWSRTDASEGRADGVAEEPEVIFFLFFHPEIISAGEEEEDS